MANSSNRVSSVFIRLQERKAGRTEPKYLGARLGVATPSRLSASSERMKTPVSGLLRFDFQLTAKCRAASELCRPRPRGPSASRGRLQGRKIWNALKSPAENTLEWTVRS